MQMLRVQDLVAGNGKAPLLSGLARPAPAAPAAPVGGWGKRTLDLGLVLLGLLLLWPLILGLVVLLKLTDPGPVLYGHRRVGFGGREFRCWKFRTMVVDGDAVLDRYLRENPAEAAGSVTRMVAELGTEDVEGSLNDAMALVYNEVTQQDGLGVFEPARLAETWTRVAAAQGLDPAAYDVETTVSRDFMPAD